ncbi:MAG: MYXO-CTERM sorting domain-containing protein [Pseudomonadota bacterium]
MTLTTLALLTQLVAGQSPALHTRSTIFDVIDARWERGEIDQATQQLWRVAAIRAPELLPADLAALRAEPATPAARLAMTRVLVEARQWATRNEARSGDVQRLLMPPADLPLTLESSTYPIRVSYRSSTSLAYAQQVLSASEHSWQVETEQYGFPAPTIEAGAEFYRVRIEPSGMGGGAYTAPYDYDMRSSWTACFSYIVFDDQNPTDYIESTMAHELNHAMQATMDCGELATFMENTATYIMSEVYPASFWETVAYMPYFQQQPWRALDFMEDRQSDGYEYGGAILPLYLVGAYAPDDGPVMLRQIWEACRQTWSSYDNDPSYYDAIARVVGQRGGPSNIEDIFVDFSEARFFVGNNNDGTHIPEARRLWGAEPSVSQYHTLRDLPVVQAAPSMVERPNPFGSNFVQLDGLGEKPLRFEFDGDGATRWDARVILFGGGAASEAHEVELDPETWSGSLTLEPGDHLSALLVVANIGDQSYDPNQRRWDPASYSYGIREVPPAPVVERIEPGTLVQGVSGQQLLLVGDGFVASDRFAVEMLAEKVTVLSSVVEASDRVKLTVDVAADAPLGSLALRVVNDLDSETTAEGLLEIVEPEPPVDTFGCDCRSTPAGTNAGLLVVLGLGLLGYRRRTHS